MLLAMGPAVVVAAPSAQASTLYEYQVVNAINAQRANYHLGRLWLSACPQSYADRWAPYAEVTWPLTVNLCSDVRR